MKSKEINIESQEIREIINLLKNKYNYNSSRKILCEVKRLSQINIDVSQEESFNNKKIKVETNILISSIWIQILKSNYLELEENIKMNKKMQHLLSNSINDWYLMR